MEKIYDLIVIGGGSAGLSTGIYAGRAKLNTLVLEKGNVGGQATTTSEVANYPGIKYISGPQLMKEMHEQAESFGVQFMTATVTDMDFSGDVKELTTDQGTLKARAVVIATGASPRKLGFPGETEFTGRGVAYCATCDGEFFTGLNVFVIGAGYAAAEEAIFLTRFAKKVTILAREPEFTCAKSIADKVLAHPKIEVKFNTEVIEATGDDMLKAIKYRNNVTNEVSEYVDTNGEGFGIFVFIGYQPQTDVFKNHIELDKWGYVITDENMRTNVKGVYAAGDLRPKALRQIVTAVADGAIAATDAEKYIAEEKERLGIKDEPVETVVEKKEEKVQSTASTSTDGTVKSKLLTDALRDQLRGILARMENDVTLLSVVDEENEKSLELRDLVLDIASLGDKLHAEIILKGENHELEMKANIDKFPAVALMNHKGEYSGVKYHGVPGGHELNSFILAIYNLAGPGQPMDEKLINQIKGLNKKVNIKVAVSLSCHLCPDVVVGSQRLAILNDNIEAEMLDIANFPALKTQYKIMSVPAMIINNEKVVFGAKKIDEIINII
ncbi:MAG: FAD-dependent oxidoreductase, partial [Bacillaceae bacterium]